MPSAEIDAYLAEKPVDNVPPWMRSQAAQRSDEEIQSRHYLSLYTSNGTGDKLCPLAPGRIEDADRMQARYPTWHARFRADAFAGNSVDSSSKVFMFNQSQYPSVVWNAAKPSKNFKDKNIENIHLLRDDLDIVSIAESEHSSYGESDSALRRYTSKSAVTDV